MKPYAMDMETLWLLHTTASLQNEGNGREENVELSLEDQEISDLYSIGRSLEKMVGLYPHHYFM
jgi:hypothetical protein